MVLWQWLHAVQGWDSKSLKSLKTPWTLVPLCAVLPLCDHSISTPFWPLGTHLGCVLSGFWLCTNHRHAFPETNKQKKKKSETSMPSSPQALAHLKGMNIQVQRTDLDISSLFFPSTLRFCAMVHPFSICPNITRKPFSFCLTHETS